MKIAIVKLSALGDIVHSMIVLQFIKQFNQSISIDWFVEESYKELLEFHPDINKVHIVKIRKAKRKKSLFILFREFKKISKLDSYDLVIDMQGLIKSAIISRIIPSKHTIGFNRASSRESLASIFYTKTFRMAYEENVIKRNFELAKFALNLPCNFKEVDDKLPFIFSKQKKRHSGLSNSKKNILIIPGASNPSKQYPVMKIAKLTQKLDANFIVIWGNNLEKNLAEEISIFSSKVHISKELSLDDLVSLVGDVDLVIGGDTGPTHIAWGLNIPSIALFGSTPGYRNTISSEMNQIIESNSKVDPLKINKKDLSIQKIEVEEVVNVAKNLLSD